MEEKKDNHPCIQVIDQLVYPKLTVMVEEYQIPEYNVALPESTKKVEELVKEYVLGHFKECNARKNFELYDNVIEYPTKRLNIGYKRIHIILTEKTTFKAIKGAMHYMKGDVSISAKVSLNFRKSDLPIYVGKGEVWMEPYPSNVKFLLYPIRPKEKIFVSFDNFYACSGNLKTSLKIVKQNIALAVLSSESKLIVTEYCCENTDKKELGWVILKAETPQSEIQKIELKNETLKVDGKFAVLRSGGIKVKLEAVAKGTVAKMLDLTGEGVVHVYSGTGVVHLHPCASEQHKQALMGIVTVE